MPNPTQQGPHVREKQPPVVQRDAPAPEAQTRPSEPPIAEAAALGAYIQIEHGRDGVRRYASALLPFVSYSFVSRLAEALHIEAPPPQQPPQTHPHAPQQQAQPPQREGISPEKMLSLLQGMGGNKDGGIDPALLIKLLRG